MLDDVLAIPDHLRDALWRVESARLEPADAAGLMVCGMGGSAIGGDLAAAALGDRLTRPLLTVRGYELPSWATPEWTVLCSSYSGDTEETLACFAAAEALGARRIVASTGGALVEDAREAGVPVIGLPGLLPAPRTAVAYMLVCAAEVAALGGHRPPGSHRDRRRGRLPGRAVRRAAGPRRGAGRLVSTGRVPVIVRLRPHRAGRPSLEDADQRERRSSTPSSPSCPRPTTTRSAAGRASAFSAVLLEDSDQHPRERRRFELTGEAIAGRRRRGDPHRDAGRDPRRPPALGDDARRPRLARPSQGARSRPAAGRGDRGFQGGSGQALARGGVGPSGSLSKTRGRAALECFGEGPPTAHPRSGLRVPKL